MSQTPLSEDAQDLDLIAGELRRGDKAAVLTRLTRLMTRIAADTPALVRLIQEDGGAAERSAYGKMQRAVTRVERDAGRAAFTRQVAQAVFEALAEQASAVLDEAAQRAAAEARLAGWLQTLQAELAAPEQSAPPPGPKRGPISVGVVSRTLPTGGRR